MPQYIQYASQYTTTTGSSSTQIIWPQNYQHVTYPQTTNGYYTIPNQVVWTNWNNATTTTMYPTYQSMSSAAWTEWVAASDDAWQQNIVEQRLEYQRRNHEAFVERQAACAKARSLLDSFLSDPQKAELERHGKFHVVGSKGRRYCIRANGQSGNVDLLRDEGGVQASLCAHPRGYLPDGDAWLSQMMEIKFNEDHFLSVANVHRGALPGDYRRELIRAA